jgi:hypothetical protein
MMLLRTGAIWTNNATISAAPWSGKGFADIELADFRFDPQFADGGFYPSLASGLVICIRHVRHFPL